MPGTTSDNPIDENDSREYGLQPLAALLDAKHVSNHQVVEASTEQLTHKMMAKACRGRFLSVKIRLKILRAVNALLKAEYSLPDLFNYR